MSKISLRIKYKTQTILNSFAVFIFIVYYYDYYYYCYIYHISFETWFCAIVNFKQSHSWIILSTFEIISIHSTFFIEHKIIMFSIKIQCIVLYNFNIFSKHFEVESLQNLTALMVVNCWYVD